VISGGGFWWGFSLPFCFLECIPSRVYTYPRKMSDLPQPESPREKIDPEIETIHSFDSLGPITFGGVRVVEQRSTLISMAVMSLLVMGFLLIAFALYWVLERKTLSGVVVLAVPGLLCVAGGFFGAFWNEQRAEARRKSDVKRVLTGASTEYFEKLVNINVENLSAYYFTVKSHANKSFLTSLYVGVVGFVLIGIGINRAINDTQHGPSVAVLAGVSGVATEFISAVFFYLYSQTVRQMKEYHDSLLAVQNILLSFKLVGDTNDPKDKAKMIEVMLEYLVGKRSDPSIGSGNSDHESKRRAKAAGADVSA